MPDLSTDISPEDYNQQTLAYLKGQADKRQSAARELAPALLGMLGMGAGKALAASKPILGAIIGPAAKRDWIPGSFGKARDLFEKGASREDILGKTGLFGRPSLQGHGAPDFKKYIPDVGLKTKPLPETKGSLSLPMKGLIDWPETFENYPHMTDLPVNITGQGKSGGGQYTRSGITLHGPVGKELDPQQLSALVHEAHHGVSDYEGWPVGANYRAMVDDAKQRLTQRNVLGQQEFAKKYPNTEKLFQTYGTDNPEDIGKRFYFWHPGETEARLNQNLLAKLRGDPLPFPGKSYGYNQSIGLLKPYGLIPEYNRSIPGQWSLRKFGTSTQIDPETMPTQIKDIWNYLPNNPSRQGSGLPLGQAQPESGPIKPWIWEDSPRGLQHDYSNNIYGGQP